MPEPNHNAHAGYELSDAHPKPVIWTVLGIFVLCAASFAFIVWFFDLLQKFAPPDPAASAYAVERRMPPPPHLQAQPATDLGQYRVKEERTLKSYQYVDRDAGIVRIPVERAMELLLERGIPAVKPGKPAGKEAPRK